MSQSVHLQCPICSSDRTAFWNEVQDYKISQETFQLFDCEECGIRFTGNPPDEKSSSKYYDSPRYISHSNSTQGIINKTYHLVRNIMLQRKMNLLQKYSSSKEVLDIGCGTGYFLKVLKDNQYSTFGIEINEGARRFAIENFGLIVKEPETLISGQINKKFGIISMWHVLEHIYSPKILLQSISKVLDDNGILVIAVPNYKSTDANHYQSAWAGYDVPRHIWHFNPVSMSVFMNTCGFKLIALHRLPFDAYYVSMLSESYKKKKLFFILGFVHGFFSWLISQFHKEKTSSLIYIFKKQK